MNTNPLPRGSGASDESAVGTDAPDPLSQSITPPEVGGELAAAHFASKRLKEWLEVSASSPSANIDLISSIGRIELRRSDLKAIATLSTPEVVDGNQVVRASAQEGTALSSQATEPQASPPCGLQSTDAWQPIETAPREFQHSQIFRTRAEAQKIAAVTRKPKLWERSIVRTVLECRTCFEEPEAETRPAHYCLGVAA